MAEVSQLSIGENLYDIQDDTARQHIRNTSNPHLTTKAQVGLGKVENLTPYEVLDKMDDLDVKRALGYIPQDVKDAALMAGDIEDVKTKTEETNILVRKKIDSETDSSVPAIVTFLNGVKVSNASIAYESATDTVIFS